MSADINKLSVLVIEDEILLQDVYKIILANQNYTVYTANNGAEGIKQLKKHLPDLVLLDIFMPIMDGREFLRNFDDQLYPNTKIIVCSNLSDETVEREMLELGADRVILKSSMAPKDLLSLVSLYLPDTRYPEVI